MACIVFYSVVVFPVVVFAGIPGMWHIASLPVLCQYSCWSNILNSSPEGASSKCPYGCYQTALESDSEKYRVRLFICFSWQYHQASIVCVLLATTSIQKSLLQPYYAVTLWLCMSLAFVGLCLFVVALMSSIDIVLCHNYWSHNQYIVAPPIGQCADAW